MGLLNDLLEKKDLSSYFRLRTARLKEEIGHIKAYPEKDRESMKLKLTGRIRELDRMAGLISSNSLRKDCKKMWKHFDGLKRKSIMEVKKNE